MYPDIIKPEIPKHKKSTSCKLTSVTGSHHRSVWSHSILFKHPKKLGWIFYKPIIHI